uniref:tRNAHis guanylyltransferase catalytic domain-containing protein n=1 Tax=viral metagenome TaxID=1070528 RepID=A0A6C0E0M7_9ZZZZ
MQLFDSVTFMNVLRCKFGGLWTTGENDDSGLFERMKGYSKRYNSKELHGFKPFVLTLKSKKLLTYINKIGESDGYSIESKIATFNTLYGGIKNVCEKLYNHFDPTFIYTFNDEIHMVFNGDTPILYNGNINRLLTNAVSVTSVYFTEEVTEGLLIGFPKSCFFEGTCVEFSRDYEVFNYIIWRQFDCKRNNMSLFYAIYSSDKHSLNGKSIDTLESELVDVSISDAIKYGILIKKEIYNLMVDALDQVITKDVMTRKRFIYSSIDLSSDFKENVNTFLYQKYL